MEFCYLWVDWEHDQACLEAVEGYERMLFASPQRLQEILRLLEYHGFQIQEHTA